LGSTKIKKILPDTKDISSTEEEAIKRGCCKMTLDVLEGNKAAQHVYLKKGFGVYEVKPDIGKACFWQKWL